MGGRGKNFYILRLKNTSFPELAYRTKQALFSRCLKVFFKKGGSPIRVPLIDHVDVESLKLPFFRYQVSSEILENLFPEKRNHFHEKNEEIKHFEEQYRNLFFADINPAKAPLDIRTVWEPARLQHITLLVASARHSTSSSSGALPQSAKEALLKWIKENLFLYGPHYISAMECGLRIPVFFYCLKLLDNPSDQEHRLILETIYLHGWWISKNLSLYSSLGNHTIAECVGLVFAGAIFRNSKAGRRWLSKAWALLKKEAYHQILNDGGPAEQSLNYHRFVLDLYWLAIDFLERNKLYDCREIKPRLGKGENFLSAFQDKNGNMPSLGDSDDGYAIAPGIHPERPNPTNSTNPTNATSEYITFLDTGYTVIRLAHDSFLTFDHGPLGMPPLYNHGHADALAVILSKNGKEMLVDPGTYRYNGEPEWRKYFKGTRAHNTVTIDGLDQAVQETSFIWSHPFKTKLIDCIERPDGFLVKAKHDGYSRLKDPVRHERSIFFFRETTFLIRDTFSGRGVHAIELNYHLHPDTTVKKINGWWVIDNQGVKVYLRLLKGLDFFCVNGQENPILGWYSPAYGMKIKSGVLHCSVHSAVQKAVFLTAICTDSPVEPKFLLERLDQFERQTANS